MTTYAWLSTNGNTGSLSTDSEPIPVEGGLDLVEASQSDVTYVNTLMGSKLSPPELLKFKGAVLCRAERNANGDGVDGKGLAEISATLPLMAIDDEHRTRMVVGFITNPRVEDEKLLIDGLIYARRFPDIAVAVASGEKHLSVEAFAESARCSQCGETFARESDYCEHLNNRMAGSTVTRLLSGLKGVGAGIVRSPAGTATSFDTNRVSFLASMDSPTGERQEVMAAADMCDSMMKPDTTEAEEPQEGSGENQTQEDLDMADTAELERTLAEVTAQLSARESELAQKGNELVASQARVKELETELENQKLASARSLELIVAGFDYDTVNGLSASLASTDEKVFAVLKAQAPKREPMIVAEPGLFESAPQKVVASKTTLGGDQDKINLDEYSGLFA